MFLIHIREPSSRFKKSFNWRKTEGANFHHRKTTKKPISFESICFELGEAYIFSRNTATISRKPPKIKNGKAGLFYSVIKKALRRKLED